MTSAPLTAASRTTASHAPAPALITIGETMVMLTQADALPLLTSARLRVGVGGAESNVAVHAAELGIDAAWVSAVGADVFGQRVRDEIAQHGVDVRWVRTDPTAPTGLYVKDAHPDGSGVLYYRRGSAASQMGPDAITAVPLEEAAVVHLSGITAALSPSCAALMDAVYARVASCRTLLSFDVNHRAALWPAAEAATPLREWARRADLVFVGLDEAQRLWGCRTADEVRALIDAPTTLVVKDGAVAATEYAPNGAVTVVPAMATQVVEPTGAGDAFAGGYLAAMMEGADATTRLTAGHRRAHLVLQSTSDVVDPTAPTPL